MARLSNAFQGILRSCIESHKLAGVSHEAEALYFRLLLVADGEGLFYGSPADVGARADPKRFRLGQVDIKSVGEALQALNGAGLIAVYEVEGDRFLHLTPYWQPSSPGRGRRQEFPSPPCPQPGDTVSPPCPHVVPNGHAEMEQEQEQEPEREREAREAPTPTLGNFPEPGTVSLEMLLARAVEASKDFHGFAERAKLCVAFEDWLSVWWETHTSPPPGHARLTSWIRLLMEFPEPAGVRVLEKAASGAWKSITRQQLEEALRA